MLTERRILQTYVHLPKWVKISPVVIARKGFYFNRNSLKVCCFKCCYTVDIDKIYELVPKHTPEACYRYCRAQLQPPPPPPPPPLPPLPSPSPPPLPPPSTPAFASTSGNSKRIAANAKKIRSKCLRADPKTVELLQQIETALEEHECRICLQESMDVVFQPCGHFCVCKNCASQMDKCPVCRREIRHQIYINQLWS